MALPPSFFSLFVLVLCFTDISAVAAAEIDYLKLPLLQKSPLPSPTQALALDAHRLSLISLRRKTHKPIPAVKSPVISGASTGSGQYFVDLRLGQPPQSLLLVADTGSDLVWVKCSACRNCSLHDPGSAYFPRHSSTFSPVHCYDPVCKLVPHPDRIVGCNRTRIHSTCSYEYSYADGSLASGLFARETTTLRTSSGGEAKLKNVAFGCGFRISGPGVSGSSFNGAHGVLGLGSGPISFSSQLGRRFANRFSYCLMDYTLSPPPTSYLIIGGAPSADVSKRRKLAFTPLIVNLLSPTFYYIQIESVYVNKAKLRISPSVWSVDESGNGGTVIDSGTTLSFLAEPAYRRILTAVKRRLRLPSAAKLTPGFDLCVNVSGIAKPGLSLPRLKFKLGGGAVFHPPPRNYFVETEEQIQCLAIRPVNTRVGFSVIGNLMQQGFLFEFDRERSRLGFSRRGCALP